MRFFALNTVWRATFLVSYGVEKRVRFSSAVALRGASGAVRAASGGLKLKVGDLTTRAFLRPENGRVLWYNKTPGERARFFAPETDGFFGTGPEQETAGVVLYGQRNQNTHQIKEQSTACVSLMQRNTIQFVWTIFRAILIFIFHFRNLIGA